VTISGETNCRQTRAELRAGESCSATPGEILITSSACRQLVFGRRTRVEWLREDSDPSDGVIDDLAVGKERVGRDSSASLHARARTGSDGSDVERTSEL